MGKVLPPPPRSPGEGFPGIPERASGFPWHRDCASMAGLPHHSNHTCPACASASCSVFSIAHATGAGSSQSPALAAFDRMKKSEREVAGEIARADQLEGLITCMKQSMQQPCNLRTHHDSRCQQRHQLPSFESRLSGLFCMLLSTPSCSEATASLCASPLCWFVACFCASLVRCLLMKRCTRVHAKAMACAQVGGHALLLMQWVLLLHRCACHSSLRMLCISHMLYCVPKDQATLQPSQPPPPTPPPPPLQPFGSAQ